MQCAISLSTPFVIFFPLNSMYSYFSHLIASSRNHTLYLTIIQSCIKLPAKSFSCTQVIQFPAHGVDVIPGKGKLLSILVYSLLVGAFMTSFIVVPCYYF